MVVGPVVNQPDLPLLDHRVLGPAAAWIAGRKSMEFDLPLYLRDRYLEGISERDRQAAVLCAARDGSKDSENLLEAILLAKLREDDGQEREGRGRRDHQQPRQPRREAPPERYAPPGRDGRGEPPDWMQGGGPDEEYTRGTRPRGREEREEDQPRPRDTGLETMRYVGRSLGYLDNYGVLRQAIAYQRRGTRLAYTYPLDHRVGAIAGMAWLPPKNDPAGRLRRFGRSLPEPNLKEACAEAVLTYYRLRSAEVHPE